MSYDAQAFQHIYARLTFHVKGTPINKKSSTHRRAQDEDKQTAQHSHFSLTLYTSSCSFPKLFLSESNTLSEISFMLKANCLSGSKKSLANETVQMINANCSSFFLSPSDFRWDLLREDVFLLLGHEEHFFLQVYPLRKLMAETYKCQK